MVNATKFSAYPWSSVSKRTRREAALESLIARHLAPTRACVVRVHEQVPMLDREAPSCEWHVHGVAIDVRGSAAYARRHATRVLGGPDELDAPRPLGRVEHALWALAVARWLEELDLPGEVWPRADLAPLPPDAIAVEILLDGSTVFAIAPRGLALRAPPPRPWPRWTASMIDAQVVVARCGLPSGAIQALAVGDLITVEHVCELEIFGGLLGLRVAPDAVVAEVVTGYVPRAMLADAAQVELTVKLGTTRLTLRDACELAVGQIVTLGRPLSGPFEVHAAGRLLGRGELVDVDGELAVRIVSLEE